MQEPAVLGAYSIKSGGQNVENMRERRMEGSSREEQ
jgi:hypothetical protein